MSRRGFLALFATALVAAAAVALRGLFGGRDAAAAAARPPEIRYGRDVCASCNMIISDERFAAAFRTATGEARVFDDVGEMVAHLRGQPQPAAAVFAHDYASHAWLPAEWAYYVRTARVASPMGFGVVAFEAEPAARAFAGEQQGEVLNWRQLLAIDLKGTMPGHGH